MGEGKIYWPVSPQAKNILCLKSDWTTWNLWDTEDYVGGSAADFKKF